MYCPNCGDQTTQGLKYCKRCGVGLSTGPPTIDQKTPFGAAMGMLFLVALVCVAGFIALFATVYNLGERPGFDTRALIAIMAFGGATVFSVVGSLVWLLLRLTAPLREASQTRKEIPVIRDYSPQLPASPGSVTENTTRNFDPSIYRDQGERD